MAAALTRASTVVFDVSDAEEVKDMARTFRPPVKPPERLMARADLLTRWGRVQAYQVGSQKSAKRPPPRSKRT